MQQSKGETRQKWRRWMAAGAVLLTVLAKLLWPEIGDGLRHLMMGPDGNAVEQAFCGLVRTAGKRRVDGIRDISLLPRGIL